MNKRVFTRVRALRADEWSLLIQTLLVMVLWISSVRVLPFPLFRPLLLRALSREGKRSQASIARRSPRDIAWAVRCIGSRLPGGRQCLVQALTLRTLLAIHGIPARLALGVAQDESVVFRAHAWAQDLSLSPTRFTADTLEKLAGTFER